MPELNWNGKRDRQGGDVPVDRLAGSFRDWEVIGGRGSGPDEAESSGWRNRLVWGDRVAVLRSLLPELESKVDLVYLDPPFFTGAEYRYRAVGPEPGAGNGRDVPRRLAYSDQWPDGLDSYLQWIYETALPVRRLLADHGSLFVHVDWRAAAYVRCALDEVFGPERLRNEIVWAYGGRGAKAVGGQFPRNHDAILWYGKTRSTKYRPLRIVRRLSTDQARRAGFRRDESGRWFKTSPRGDYTDLSVARLEAAGRIHRTRGGTIRVKYYLDQEGEHVVDGAQVGDVWTDIADAMHLPAGEKTGYPTQKPERLLERVLLACTEEGDLVLDCCCGSGTAAAVAERLRRRWIAADSSAVAVHATRQRLLTSGRLRPFVVQARDGSHRQGAGDEAREAVLRERVLGRFGARPIDRTGSAGPHGLAEGPHGPRVVYVGRSDAPITLDEVRAAAAALETLMEAACSRQRREPLPDPLAGREDNRALTSPGDAAACLIEALALASRNGPDERRAVELDVLGRDFAFDAAAAAEALRSRQIDARFHVVLEEALSGAAAAASRPAFAEPPSLSISVKTSISSSAGSRLDAAERHDRMVCLTLDRFTPSSLCGAESAGGGDLRVDGLACWAVDWDHRGGVFRDQWCWVRASGGEAPATTAVHSYGTPGERVIAVKGVDLLGVAALRTVVVAVR